MKQLLITFLLFLICLSLFAQKEFHVTTSGHHSGDGSLQRPWDLQTAISQKPSVVNGGDIIWVHGGIYSGRYTSTIRSTKDNSYITVAPFQQEHVILNGNVDSNKEAVLNVTSTRVIFRNFEITWLGDFSRNENDQDFRRGAGVFHTSGEDCMFDNLKIHNNPGLGFGSWKQTGGTIIENCLIYHNGWIAKNGKGRGEGMYVQNSKDQTRIIRNNIIFSNYYKGIEVWSAGRDAEFQYVKNITLENNIIFNSGSPTGNHYDNVIIATDDRNGVNFANNIKVVGNVFYHNTNYLKNEVNGDAPSLTLGYTDNSPVENITVKNNIILGRNNALRILHVKSMSFRNNTIYGGYIFLNKVEMAYTKHWNLENNSYFTKKNGAFRIHQDKNYALKSWQDTFKLDNDSQWDHIKNFNLPNVLRVTRLGHQHHTFNVALFNKQGNDVKVDFTSYKIPIGTKYQLYDVEHPTEVLASGMLNGSRIVSFPMNNLGFSLPLHNDLGKKTLSNFGVFRIKFDTK